MENKTDNYFDETSVLVKNYVDDRLLLLKIQSAKKTAKITSRVIYIFIASILLFFVFMFLGFTLAYYFAEKFNSNFYGFTSVACIYLIIFLLFTALYKSYFSTKIKNMITQIFFENELPEDDED